MMRLKYYVFENIMENRVFAQIARFSIIFSKVFKTLLKFFLTFLNFVLKNRKLCHDLKIAYISGFSMVKIKVPASFNPFLDHDIIFYF